MEKIRRLTTESWGALPQRDQEKSMNQARCLGRSIGEVGRKSRRVWHLGNQVKKVYQG